MRLRAALLFVFTVVGLAVITSPADPAWACSCAWSPAEQDEHAELIVVGRVTEVTDTSVRLAIESVEKGDADRTAPLKLRVGRSEASCGYEFRTGLRYRVNARDGATGLCTGVAELAFMPPTTSPASPAASAVPAEPVAMRPAAESSGSSSWIAAGAGLTVLAAAAVAVAVWRRGRRS
ncbi:hypothetical protein [Actinoplanes aureus]|uniref:Tissue inhibitor of metalloproteinase n=1 Tax=Actinoplanes aureus TaxID=2792083 RepID=A0A931G0G9_9ACTN|nr:hypothetical protein [Actinoplanes aureus]MBG0566773.1 hypothetical protein [Actinoplanes aureus]